MTDTTNLKSETLQNYILKGARKSELYEYYKPHSRKIIMCEILEVLQNERNINEAEAKRVVTLKGSEVALLEGRLG